MMATHATSAAVINRKIDAMIKKNPAKKVSPIYLELKKQYLAGEFPDITMRPGEGREVLYYSKDGRFLQAFDSRLLAEKEYNKQWNKASKFIGREKNPSGTRVKVVARNPVKRQRVTSENDYALVSGNHWTVRFYANKTEAKGVADIVYPASSEASAQRFVDGLEKAGASGVAVIALRKVRSK